MPRRPRPDPPDRGSVPILAVAGFGLVAVLVVLSLTGPLVAESRAVEDSLAQVRGYWAAMGLNNYALSRIMQSGGCSGNCGQPSLAGVVQGYLNEIATGSTGVETWMYPDLGPNYAFAVKPTATLDTSTANAGEILIQTIFGPCGAPPPKGGTPPCPSPPQPGPNPPANKSIDALRMLSVMRPVSFRFCEVASGSIVCGSGPSKNLPGAQLITSIHRSTN